MKLFVLFYGIMADLIIRYLPNFKKNEYCFAFLAHPRNLKDATHKFPFLKLLPKILQILIVCDINEKMIKFIKNRISSINSSIESMDGLITPFFRKYSLIDVL